MFKKNNSLDNSSKKTLKNQSGVLLQRIPPVNMGEKVQELPMKFLHHFGLSQSENISVQQDHRKKRSFKCLWCTEVFGVIKEFNQHVKDKDPDVKYTCHFCSREY